jgi:hypothetical protein
MLKGENENGQSKLFFTSIFSTNFLFKIKSIQIFNASNRKGSEILFLSVVYLLLINNGHLATNDK